MTLRWRLTLLYLSGSFLIFLLALLTICLVYRYGSTSLADRTLMRAVDEITDIVENQGFARGDQLRLKFDSFSDENAGLFISLSDSQGRSLYESDPDVLAGVPHSAELKTSENRASLQTLSLSKRGVIRLASFRIPSYGIGTWVKVGTSLPPFLSLFAGWQAYAIFLFFIVLLVVLGWTGWWIAGRTLKPIDRITQVAQVVSRGVLEERIPHHGVPDELGRLIDVLNDMLERIENATKKLRHFSSNVSHQLRTPLTILRGETEVTLRNPQLSPQDLKARLENNLSELESMSELVEDLLSYARTENDGKAIPTAQRLDLFVQEVKKKADVLARPKNQSVGLEAQVVSAVFHTGRLEQALLNVLDNAVKNTPAQGRITLRIFKNHSHASVQVEDTGSGVSEEEIPHLFERGRSHSGSGIGLSLARALVESFSGTLEVQSRLGQGLTVDIRLPLTTE